MRAFTKFCVLVLKPHRWSHQVRVSQSHGAISWNNHTSSRVIVKLCRTQIIHWYKGCHVPVGHHPIFHLFKCPHEQKFGPLLPKREPSLHIRPTNFCTSATWKLYKGSNKQKHTNQFSLIWTATRWSCRIGRAAPDYLTSQRVKGHQAADLMCSPGGLQSCSSSYSKSLDSVCSVWRHFKMIQHLLNIVSS